MASSLGQRAWMKGRIKRKRGELTALAPLLHPPQLCVYMCTCACMYVCVFPVCPGMSQPWGTETPESRSKQVLLHSDV